MKLFTVGLVLVTAAVAGCSSTTAGADGAIQDDVELAATSSASPSSSSAGPTSSPDPVASPTDAPSSSSAGPTSSPDPVASPTDAPSATDSPDDQALLGATAENNNVCDLDLDYKCGDTGPGGGTVFYALSTGFACGADMGSKCNYLESAPNLWRAYKTSCKKAEGDKKSGSYGGNCGGSSQETSDFTQTGDGFQWCPTYAPGNKELLSGAVATAIGSGYANTIAYPGKCNSKDSYTAAQVAQYYNGGGQTDWFLPSKDELDALYYYSNRAAIGGFNSAWYWSSTQVIFNNGSKGYNYAVFRSFQSQPITQYQSYKEYTLGVRPIRAF
jgi:hypothetical protein